MICTKCGYLLIDSLLLGRVFCSLNNNAVCYRRIQLVELNGDRLVERQSTFVSLTDAECNVATIATKVSETLNSGEEYVLLDSRNQELMDCPVTQGY